MLDPRLQNSEHSSDPAIGQRRSLPPVAEGNDARIHPWEKALLAVTCVHLTFLPWALGTMHVWSQILSLAFGVLSLGLAVQARHYPKRRAGGLPYVLRPFPRLLQYPIFWCGAAFLVYIVVQGLNPGWEYIPTRSAYWLKGLAHVGWLPSGLRTPFADANPWRSLVIYGSAWLSACAVWTGFTRRKTLRILLVVLVVNASLLALLGLLERASHADRIFWSWVPPANYFVASFVYRNHAGAYFDLTLAICCALGCWYYRRQALRQDLSGPAVIFGLLAAILAAIVLYSYSRGATLLMIGFLAVVAGMIGRMIFSTSPSGRSLLTVAFVGGLFVALAGLSLYSLKNDRMGERMRTLPQEVSAPAGNIRIMVAEATWQMAEDALALGWGAGSYRYVFPGYQVRFPAIMTSKDNHKRLLFEHAHNDYLELLAEFGIVGGIILAAGLVYYFVALARLRVWRNQAVSILFLGCIVTGAHAAFDFPLANPAILTTWCCLWPAMLRWLEIENQPEKL